MPNQQDEISNNIDWTIFIERDQALFLTALFISPYSKLAKKEFGFGFDNQLYLYNDGYTAVYRSKKELEASKEYFSNIIKNDPEKVLAWSKEAKESNQWADSRIEEMESKDLDALDKSELEKDIDQIQTNLLYCTLLPTWILSSLDEVSENKKVEKITSSFENLNSESRYPHLVDTVLAKYWKKGAEISGKKQKQISLLTPEELLSVFKDKELDFDEVMKRKQSVFWHDNGVIRFSYEDKIYKKFLPSTTSKNEDTIEGAVAFEGKVIGTVRIVNKLEDMEKVEKGDVLVSFNTNPSLMPAIKKAGAIVTDEGGITCHAAIVSRELEIPCVIGTEVATKVLDDGDKVEVDANEGVINIIEKNE